MTNAQMIYDCYRAIGDKMEPIIVPGLGHEAVPKFFEEPRLVEFLKNVGFAESKN